ncbi:F-box/kelch-repeat protein At1g57790 [Jatropha curcas]|nr:F-box/kelch-repeat protein At1g57790 [Jatropha curcas]
MSSSPKVRRASNVDNTTRQWSDLPHELLAKIASLLGIIDLLSFRGVCKDWKSASNTASAEIESISRQPGFLLYGETHPCVLLTESGKRYKINIPELNDNSRTTTCIASQGGWLLILTQENSAVYFFCPFSRSRIDLPNLPPDLNLSNYGASFTSPPTSKDCVVSFICQEKDSLDFELYILSRGDKGWKNYKLENRKGKLFKNIKFAGFFEEEFNFFDDNDNLVTFSVKDSQWRKYNIVPHRVPAGNVLRFMLITNHFEKKDMKQRLGLEGEDVSISVCGTAVYLPEKDFAMFSETITGSPDSQSKCLKGVWIYPRFFSIPMDQRW